MSSFEATERFNRVVVPIYELDAHGMIKPNTLFHRSWDKLHSRCIEYPFAASQLGNAKCILDVGTVKSDFFWIQWLENLPIEIHATDYDHPQSPFHNVCFHRADVRQLPIADNTFDVILAVSVIEHIGLENPQVVASERPRQSTDGDVEAVRELVRVLKPGGRLIMTFPFGVRDTLILGDSARSYTINSIKKFEALAKPIILDYYEYQYANRLSIFKETQRPMPFFAKILKRKAVGLGGEEAKNLAPPEPPGLATWRRIPLASARATHLSHVDGVLCGVWIKQGSHEPGGSPCH